jgi:P pilus assembly chaperone PapD
MRHHHHTAAAIVLALASVATAATASAAGGLGISPAIVEAVAAPGHAGIVTVSNTTSVAMRVTVRARPWIQPRSGIATPDRRHTLGRVRVGPPSFTLPAGQRRAIDVSLLRAPAGGSLYGNLEIVGAPQGAPPRGAIRTRYRLIAALRLDPAAAKRLLKVQVGRLRARGTTVLMALRNSGNTVMPITGSVRITGGAGTVRTTLAEARILPGATVDVSLRSGKLLAGRYVADMTLRQGGRSVATAKRVFRVR